MQEIREVIVDVDNFPEVGKYYTGRTGGRVKVTRELFLWILDQVPEVVKSIPGYRTPRKGDIISAIQVMLQSGKYKNEKIYLSESTIEKILSWRYPDMLKDGMPASEKELSEMEHYRESVKEDMSQRKEALAAWSDSIRHIWLIVSNDISVLTEVPWEAPKNKYQEELQKEKITRLFPGVWFPEEATANDMKNMIKYAVRVRPRKAKPERRTQAKSFKRPTAIPPEDLYGDTEERPEEENPYETDWE